MVCNVDLHFTEIISFTEFFFLLSYNHQSGSFYNNGGLCLQNSFQFFVLGSVWFWVCLFLGWGGYVGYWVYVIVSWGLDLVLGLCVS